MASGQLHVRWERTDDGVRWAQNDGLVMALVHNLNEFDRALYVVKKQLIDARAEEPGASGVMMLDAEGDWIWQKSGAVDFTALARAHKLPADRIVLALADGEDVATAGKRYFAEHHDALFGEQATASEG